MNKFSQFCKNNICKLLFILTMVIFFIAVFLSLIYLYLKLTYAITDFSNLVQFPFAENNKTNSIATDPSEKEKVVQNPEMMQAGSNQIKMLYPQKENGRVWFANWTDGNQRTLASGQNDPFDPQFIARGNGSINIDGFGVAQMQGAGPRVYVYDPVKKEKWGDVEVTVYAKRISESGKSNSQGIVIGAKSEHQDATSENPCRGTTYYGRLLFDGRAVFQKELVHGIAYSTNKPAESNKAEWDTPDGTMPRNMWIGVKFVAKTNPDGQSVKLELYRDLTDGADGGTWEKVAEYIDRGDWSLVSKNSDIEKRCGIAANKVLSEPGTSVFIRNDNISSMEYKLFTIREIE